MTFTKLIPNIFYADISVGLELFVSCLEFKVVYEDMDGEQRFCVVGRDGLEAHLIESEAFAEKDRPELRLVTTNIQEVYERVSSSFPALLHPNSKSVELRPWNAKEFALMDASGICVVIQEW